ncbi:MAG: CHAT domain-containing protein [Rivularia sp. (in: cyanobacteria)]
MQTLHIELKSKSDSFVEFRYYWDNPNDFRKRTLELSEITDLLKAAELDYYTPLPEDFAKIGRKLFNWLDGSDRHLAEMLEPFQCNEGLIIAISTAGKLAHLPWELLHDGLVFLVERSLIPVRWFPKTSQGKVEPANRPLRVLFMAASPLGVEPVLNFEAEEAMILDATKEQPLQLEVEESGCLTGLGNVVKSNKLGYFDVLHLTGHAVIKDGQPRFLTEKETGERHYASAEDIAQALAFRFRTPRLVFLSGCRTGQAAKAGDVPSMAEALLQQGATAVLGWGRTVLDTSRGDKTAEKYSQQEIYAATNMKKLPEK